MVLLQSRGEVAPSRPPIVIDEPPLIGALNANLKVKTLSIFLTFELSCAVGGKDHDAFDVDCKMIPDAFAIIGGCATII
jgi:hypothetical protein